MPKTKSVLTPAEYAVLGLLREKPAYGYELQHQLTGNRGLGRVCPVEPAMVYAILKSLAKMKLIDGVWDNTAYPPKMVHSANEKGHAAFEKWLRSPVGRMREVRLDFLIKLYFALKEDSSLAEELLTAQLTATKEYASEIQREQDELGSGLDSFDAIVLESKASAARITREWLEKCLDNLSQSLAAPR